MMETVLRVVAWNLNHRSVLKAIPGAVAIALDGLHPDVVLLTEFVDGPGRGAFRSELDEIGLGYQVVSPAGGRYNQVLAAARFPIFTGHLEPPTFDGFARSNFLHLRLHGFNVELVGLRVPAYKRKLDRVGYTELLSAVLSTAADGPIVVAGDFNADPFSGLDVPADTKTPWALVGGFSAVNPDGEWSFVNGKGQGKARIDHVAHTARVDVSEVRYIAQAGGQVLAGPREQHPLSGHAALTFLLRDA